MRHIALFTLLMIMASACQSPKESDQDSYDYREALLEKQLDFVNSRWQAYLCIQLVTFKNATSEEHFSRCDGSEPASLWQPTGMEVEQWADVLIDSRMSGGWLTTKHHGGFCLWDSEYTDYDVGSAPVKDDVVQKFVEKFREKGLKIGLYYSILDTHHGIVNGDVSQEDITFMKNQITELLTNYGPIDYINFDGWATWPTVPTFDDVPYYEIYNTVKALQPECLIINHQYESNLAHADIPFADAAGRPYPYHPDYMRPTAGSDVIQQDWFWDDDNFFANKSVDYILSQLDSYNSHNGVYILNISPNTEGRLDDDAILLLKEVAEAWEKPEALKAPGDNWGFQYDVKKNLAFMQKTSQSSTHPFINDKRAYPRAEIAIDGVIEGNCSMEQCSWTLEEDQPWWEVDLGKENKIQEITIYNRTDTAMNQLSDFTVSVLDQDGKLVWESVQTDYPNPSLSIPVKKARGQYVKIQLNGEGALALAEVIVK